MIPGPGVGIDWPASCDRTRGHDYSKEALTFGADIGADWALGVGWSIGVNIQVYQPAPGEWRLGIFGRGSPMKWGFSAGVSATANVGQGWGEWQGPFYEIEGALGPATGGYYQSPTYHNSGANGYKGFSGGVTGGAPFGFAASEMNYTEWFSMEL